MPLQAGDVVLSTAHRNLQDDLSLVAASRGPQASQGCVWFGNACCKMMSNGIWRCSFPGGACTPGLEACPAWLTNEIKRQSEFYTGMGFTMQPGFPSRRRKARMTMRMAMLTGQHF